MEKTNLIKMIVISLLLMSFVQIFQHFRLIPDIVYGGLMGVTLGIMCVGLCKTIKLKNRTSNR